MSKQISNTTKTFAESLADQIAFQEIYASRHPECSRTAAQLAAKYEALLYAAFPRHPAGEALDA